MSFHIFLAVLVGFVCTSVAEIPIENNVLVLDDDSFAAAIKEHELLLVEFYAPWCGHCKKLAPEWDLAAAALAKENSVAKLAKVDTVEATAVYKKYEISSFPTILFFKNRRQVPYKGARTADAIVAWVKRHSTSPVASLETIDALIAAQQATKVVVLGYFPDLTTKIMQNKRDVFFEIAESMEHLDFYETSEESLAVYINLLEEETIDKAHIFILKSFDKHLSERPLQLDRKLVTESVMTDYVKHYSYELFPEFNRENAKRIFAPRIMNHGWIIMDQESVDYENHLKEVYFLAHEFKGRVQFINLPSHNEAYMKQFDVDMNALPALFLMDVQSMTQYAYKGLFQWAPLSEYTLKMLNGTADKHRKSEEVMPEDTAGSVTVLRASSFDDLVQNNDKDVLVFFYASWCGYCQNFIPIFDELGEKFKASENVVIAKIDAIENDIDEIMTGIVVESFPTLYYISGAKNEKTAVLYEGSRELKDLIEYVNLSSGSTVDHSEL